jgi:hypothetical protein
MTAPVRIRKAWRIQHDDYDATVYGETRSKATYLLYSQTEQHESFAAFLRSISVSRDEGRDVHLPARHPLAATLDSRILSNVVHAFGGTGLKAGYRDHFYTSDQNLMMKAAYYHGLFRMFRVPQSFAGSRDMISYTLTDLGKNVARGEAETYPSG